MDIDYKDLLTSNLNNRCKKKQKSFLNHSRNSDVTVREDENLSTSNYFKDTDLAIEVVDLCKSFGKKQVLNDISLSISQGEVIGYLGKNGAGKSTTIDCLVGLKRPTSGSIKILGHDIVKESLITKSLIGYVPSEPFLYECMNGFEYLSFIASSFKMSQFAFDRSLFYLKNKLLLSDDDLSKRISSYSFGMKQKLSIMASLIHNPVIWILDEISLGLDPMVSDSIKGLICDFTKDNKTVFLASHNLGLVQEVCSKCTFINDGSIILSLDFRTNDNLRKDLETTFKQICY